ncbi:MAG: hypothetical protein PHX61_14485 [Alphaproteobacteria bacterium]|nr:hypothetical protein [Alphaproteobacteria bacterium]
MALKRKSRMTQDVQHTAKCDQDGFTDRPVFKWLIGLGIPIAISFGISFSGWLITRSIEGSKIDYEYVRLSIDILSNETRKSNDTNENARMKEDNKLLRNWAIRVLDSKSPIKFTEEEKKALQESNFPLSFFELKKHSENPSAEPLNKGLGGLLNNVLK